MLILIVMPGAIGGMAGGREYDLLGRKHGFSATVSKQSAATAADVVFGVAGLGAGGSEGIHLRQLVDMVFGRDKDIFAGGTDLGCGLGGGCAGGMILRITVCAANRTEFCVVKLAAGCPFAVRGMLFGWLCELIAADLTQLAVAAGGISIAPMSAAGQSLAAGAAILFVTGLVALPLTGTDVIPGFSGEGLAEENQFPAPIIVIAKGVAVHVPSGDLRAVLHVAAGVSCEPIRICSRTADLHPILLATDKRFVG